MRVYDLDIFHLWAFCKRCPKNCVQFSSPKWLLKHGYPQIVSNLGKNMSSVQEFWYGKDVIFCMVPYCLTMILAIGCHKCLLHAEQMLLYITSIMHNNSICERSNPLCQAICAPSLSPWQHLWENWDTGSVLFTREVFVMLLNWFYSPSHLQQYIQRSGRPCFWCHMLNLVFFSILHWKLHEHKSLVFDF